MKRPISVMTMTIAGVLTLIPAPSASADNVIIPVEIAIRGDDGIADIESVLIARLVEAARYDVVVGDELTEVYSIRIDGTITRGVWDIVADVSDPAGTSKRETARIDTGSGFFPGADAFALRVIAALEEFAGPAGTVRFVNTGAPQPYLTYVDGAYVGNDVARLRLPPGSHTIVITRRDGRSEAEVGRRTVEVAADDLIELRFSLPSEPPELSGFDRLRQPEPRWRAVLDTRATGLLLLSRFNGIDNRPWFGAAATAMIADAPVRGALLYGEGGAYRLASVVEADRRTVDVTVSPIIGGVGVIAGPIAGLDFLLRVGGGVAHVDVSGNRTSLETTDLDGVGDLDVPITQAVMQMGVALGRRARLSIQYGGLAVISDGEITPLVEFGIGLGARF